MIGQVHVLVSYQSGTSCQPYGDLSAIKLVASRSLNMLKSLLVIDLITVRSLTCHWPLCNLAKNAWEVSHHLCDHFKLLVVGRVVFYGLYLILYFTGTSVASLTCSDSDGSTSSCTLSIQSGDDATAKFQLSGTDIQTTANAINYESLSGQNYMYTLVVIGTDVSGATEKTGTATVLVTITNENEGTPAISGSTPTSPITVSVVNCFTFICLAKKLCCKFAHILWSPYSWGCKWVNYSRTSFHQKQCPCMQNGNFFNFIYCLMFQLR